MKRLGFFEAARARHGRRFEHPTRKPANYQSQPNFILIPHKVYRAMSFHIVKEIEQFGFTEKEIKNNS